MRIALTLLSGIGYGGATYFRNLLPTLAAIDQRNEYHCFVPDRHPLIASLRVSNVHFHEVVRERTSALERFRFEQLALPRELRRLRIDLLYTAKNVAVFRAPCPQIIAIRNMEPFMYREFENTWLLDVQSRVKWELTKRSIVRAAGIVAVSQAVRDAVVERFPDTAQEISVVYNGTPAVSLRATEGSEVISSHDARDRHVPLRCARDDSPFLLSASKFVAYANQLVLVEAYARLVVQRPNAPPIWFAGGIHDARYFRRVQLRVSELQLTDRIRFLGLVPQGELHRLMRRATMFVFPSMCEACPHTLLEGMACGVPIAASDAPPMPELCGPAAAYFDPRNPEDIAATIERLLDDATLRNRLVATGAERIHEFTWERTARGLVETFSRIGHSALIR
ncbi:MAG: glycosyltransferase family 1 protein [Candidatus Peregrinibacteria bacterium]|nr:glycosyltransferase family 1 protein [Candidatus Peregrinibacteria bacterium]